MINNKKKKKKKKKSKKNKNNAINMTNTSNNCLLHFGALESFISNRKKVSIVHTIKMQEISTTCDGKIIKIPRWDFIFCTCENGAVWHLIPRRISPCSESFLGHIGTGILCGFLFFFNLGLD